MTQGSPHPESPALSQVLRINNPGRKASSLARLRPAGEGLAPRRGLTTGAKGSQEALEQEGGAVPHPEIYAAQRVRLIPAKPKVRGGVVS